MRGVKSNGMLLAASDAAHETVELLSPAEGVTTRGESVVWGRGGGGVSGGGSDWESGNHS